MLHRLAAAITLAALLPLAALAQTAPAPDTVVSLKPFMDQVVWPIVGAIAAAVGSALGLWLFGKLARRLDLKNDDSLRGIIETAIGNGIALALAKLSDVDVRIDTKSEAVAEAARYAMAHAPDALRTMKITPEKLHEAVQARLEKALQSPPPQTVEVKQ